MNYKQAYKPHCTIVFLILVKSCKQFSLNILQLNFVLYFDTFSLALRAIDKLKSHLSVFHPSADSVRQIIATIVFISYLFGKMGERDLERQRQT